MRRSFLLSFFPAWAVAATVFLHFSDELFVPRFPDAGDASFSVGFEDKTEYFSHEAVEFFAFSQWHDRAVGATDIAVFRTTGADFAPCRLVVFGASGAFSLKVARACPAIKAACGNEFFGRGRHQNSQLLGVLG